MRSPACAVLAGLALAASLAGTWWGAVAPAAAQEGTRHAGVVVAVLPSMGRLALDELSPGIRERRVEVRVGPQTEVVRIAREPREVTLPAPANVRHTVSTYTWGERPMDLADIRPGDFVVVEVAGLAPAGQPAPAARVEVTARAGR